MNIEEIKIEKLDNRISMVMDTLEEISISFDDAIFFAKKDFLIKQIAIILKEITEITNPPIEIIRNIESTILMFFKDSYAIIAFSKISISAIEIIKINGFFKSSENMENLRLFIARFNDKFIVANSIPLIFKIIQDSYKFLNNTIKNIGNDEKPREGAIKLFNNILDEIKEAKNILEKGQIIFISMFVAINFLSYEDIADILYSKTSLIKHIKKFYKKSDKFFMARFFEWALVNELWKKEEPKPLYHYTTLESLYSMLKNKQLKFTIETSLNDIDEGKMLTENDDRKVFTFSLTTEKDGLDLFGNYTNMEGIAIEFNSEILENTFSNVAFLNKEETIITLVPFDFGNINYFNDPLPRINKTIKNIMKKYKRFLNKESLSISINHALKYMNIFYKKEPWKYEKEFRIAINTPTENISDKKIISGELFDDSILLNVNLDRLIKGFILGPKIKQNEFKRKTFNNIIKEFKLEDKPITETAANLNIK